MTTDVDRKEDARPNFDGFVRALRDEASWLETTKGLSNDAQGRTDSDATALRRLASKAQHVGIKQGYLKGPVL